MNHLLTGKPEEIRALLDSVDTFLFDCDGVIWHGDNLIPNVAHVLERLREMGKRILFVSNNSTKSRRQYLKKFTQLNIEAYVNEVFGSAYAAAYYIKHNLELPDNKKVYIVGMSGIQEELDAEGIKHCGSSDDNENLTDMSEMSTIKNDPDVGAVLFGFDLDLNYKKLAKAFTYLQNPETHFLATNTDLTFPTKNAVYPGTGALLAALSTPLGRKPLVMGKPEQRMLDVIVDKYHLDRSRTCMVGDRLDTDILFGQNGGMKTLLVLTGVTPAAGLDEQEIKADFVIDSLGHLL
ncbi:2-phosphoglycolate phosphatase [Rhizoclosmatium globosum]|uniref:4-nitrophenylphosphatase n=1 Tax=Rhizoclosmatium globosum TaxID=329046 RepID=A0A1Y2CUX5_9FUNG|nr:2-phosphoglycolate phosphatase [Rhizoclosmatium globosum]|eukprot:ORY50767.1 2-phosphoglycolate phosphatase [Rhizoclosmatium globosum]